MSGSASSEDDDLADRVFEDLHDHERTREAAGESADPELRRIIREAVGDETSVSPENTRPENFAEDVPDFPRYEIRERIGEGATAIVYGAWDRELKRTVALKVLRERATLNEIARLRFRREAQAAAGLAHPNLVTVFDAGESGGRLYIVMELVEGRSFRDLLKDGNATPRAILALIAKAARGIAAAHAKGIVHRDLKPANILVTSTGEPKVGDFGLAHLTNSGSEVTRTGTPLGTPLYMSPEQVEGNVKEQSPRTDVYALGAILYEAVVGRTPHTGETVVELYRKIVDEEPRIPPDAGAAVSEDLRTVVLKALEKEPAHRYATAEEFAADLEACLRGDPIAGRRPSVARRLLKRLRKNAVVVAVAAAAVLGILGTWFLGSTRSDARYNTERDATVAMMRQTARLSLEAALQSREKGENEKMREYLPALEEAYRGARERAPQLAEVEYLMGRMHRALMDNDKALGFQEAALKKEPDYVPALYERAVLLSRRWGLEILPEPAGPRRNDVRDGIVRDLTALLKVQEGGKASPLSDVQLLTAKGMLAHFQGRQSEARELLEAAVKKAPLLDEAWETLARVTAEQTVASKQREREKKWLEEEKSFTESILRDRGFLPYLLGRGDVRRDRGNERANRGENPLPDYQASEADYTEALRLNRESQEGWHRRSIVRTLRAGFNAVRNQDPLKDFAEAEKDAREWARLTPKSEQAVVWRSVVRVLRGDYLAGRGQDPLPDYSLAVEDATEGLRLNPRSEDGLKRRGIAHLRRAVHLRSAEEFSAAETDLAAALALKADSSEVRLWRGILRIEQGRFREQPADFEDAERELSKAIELRADYARAQMWRGIARMCLGKYDAGRTDLTDAIQVNRGFTEVWLWRGVIEAKRGIQRAAQGGDPRTHFADAESDFSHALGLDPGYAEAWSEKGNLDLERGRICERSGDLPRARRASLAALQSYDAALRINPALRTRLEAPREEAARRAKSE